ncbi:MAG: hypothetical protein ACOY0T_21770 [Myxococcota bacterium]
MLQKKFREVDIDDPVVTLFQMLLCLLDGRVTELTWSAVRELTRVATPETERAWLDAARGKTVRQVEELVSGRAPGDLPSDAADPALRLYVLRHEVHGETRALWLEALAKLRLDAGETLDDDATFLLITRRILADEGEAKADAGRAATRCR